MNAFSATNFPLSTASAGMPQNSTCSFHFQSDQGPQIPCWVVIYLNLLSFPRCTHTSRVPGSTEQEEEGRTLRQVGGGPALPWALWKSRGPLQGLYDQVCRPAAPWPGSVPEPIRANPGQHGPALTHLHLRSGLPKPGCQPAVPGGSRLSCPSCPSHSPRLDHPRDRACSLSTRALPLLRLLLPAWKVLSVFPNGCHLSWTWSHGHLPAPTHSPARPSLSTAGLAPSPFPNLRSDRERSLPLGSVTATTGCPELLKE